MQTLAAHLYATIKRRSPKSFSIRSGPSHLAVTSEFQELKGPRSDVCREILESDASRRVFRDYSGNRLPIVPRSREGVSPEDADGSYL